MGDCWSVAPMRGMLSLQCTWVPCYPLPRTRINEHRDLTSQLADESDFERQERGFGGHNAHLVRRQRLAWQSIRKDELDNTFMNPNQLAAINIIIDGSAFTFQSRNTYNIALKTTRNNIYTFTITA